MKKTFICEGCFEPCYLTVVFDYKYFITPTYCPYNNIDANWQEYENGEDDE